MIDLEFLKQLDRFSIIVNKRITSSFSGERKTPFRGKGLVFKDFTMYAPGEDIRTIDWRVYARTNKLFVKRYEEERNLVIHIVLDFSSSMKFGKQVKKAEYASMLGMGFAYLAMKNNEKFVLSTFSDKLELFRPRKGRRQLATIFSYLSEKEPKGLSKFEESLAKYKKLITSKSLVVIISDFLYNPEEIKNTLYRLKHHEIKLIQVLDPVEVDLNLEGDYKLKDSETGQLMQTYISPYLRKRYQGQLGEHNAKIEQACNDVRARFFSVSTDMKLFDAFFKVCVS